MGQRRNIGGLQDDVLITAGVIAAAYFIVIRPIMQDLTGSPEDKQRVDLQQTLPPDENFFSFLYGPFQDNYNAHPSYGSDGNPMSMQEFFQIVKQNNEDGNPVMIDRNVNIAQLSEDLVNALSAWHLATDSSAVFAVFAPITNKTQVASMGGYLYYNYQKDLLSLLKGSIFKTGLSQGDLSLLIQELNALPDN